MIIKTTLAALWVLVALLEGCRDGFFFHYKNSAKADAHDMHWLFTFERTMVMALICWVNAGCSSILNTGTLALALMLSFSFFHNGMYYSTRHTLDKGVYPKGWWDASTTSTARIELGAMERTFLAAVGIIGIIATFTFK